MLRPLLLAAFLFSSSINFPPLSAYARNESIQPNIILVMTDDQGYGDLGVTGNSVIDTPHIDAMAKRSATVERFYVSPVCTPTRACLMTGRYNYRTRAIDTYKGRAMMDAGETTVAEILKSQGYATGIFGKWHLGDNYPLRAMDQGFEESLIHRGGGIAQPSEPVENNRRYTNPILIHNGIETPTKGYCTDIYFDAAMKFIEKADQQDKPFFVYIADNVPHGPFHDVPEKLYAKYKAMDLSPILLDNKRQADTVARVFAMVENVDRNMGILFDRLDSLDLTENTIVIFMCDNGPNTTRYVGEMRGRKSDVLDGGIRSPFFFQWPAGVKAGTKVDRIAAHIDILPTLVDATGATVPDDVKLDGRSILPLLQQKEVRWKDRYLFLQTHRGRPPQRWHHAAVVGQRYKLVRPSGFGNKKPKSDSSEFLYDLQADPKEMNDIKNEHPQIAAEMKAAYHRWFDDVSSTRKDNYAPPRIVIGTENETRTVLTQQDWQAADTPGWGKNGRWLVTVEKDSTFKASVLMLKPVTGDVTVTIGDEKTSTTVTGESQTVIEVGEISAKQGETTVQGRIISDGREINVHQVVLELVKP